MTASWKFELAGVNYMAKTFRSKKLQMLPVASAIMMHSITKGMQIDTIKNATSGISYSLEKLVHKETQLSKGMQIDMVTHNKLFTLTLPELQLALCLWSKTSNPKVRHFCSL